MNWTTNIFGSPISYFSQVSKLNKEISNCIVCKEHLPLGPRPIFAVHPKSKIIIIGQALGTVVHKTGIPWDDKSGENK